MDIKLLRQSCEPGGIFGVLSSKDTGEEIAVTLEHSYAGTSHPVSYIPKVPPGEYTCVRGMHQLAHMSEPFETFEITDVPGHSKILFHVGNTNNDTEGCVLLGATRLNSMILLSRLTFLKFMHLQLGVNSFTLIVE